MSEWLSIATPNQAPAKPIYQFLIADPAGRGIGDGVRNRFVDLDEFVAASPDHQLHKIQRRSLVSVRKSVIGDNSVNQCGRLLVDRPVVSVVRASESRPDRMLVDDPWSATELESFLVASNGIGPGNTVVPPTDLRGPAWPFGALPKFAR